MRVLVTGGRDFWEHRFVFENLDRLHALHGFQLVIHGNARGVDRLAEEWAGSRGVMTEPHPADWKRFGRGAGVKRNQEMLNSQPDLVIAFPGGRGTADMIARAEKAGIPVVRLQKGVVSNPTTPCL